MPGPRLHRQLEQMPGSTTPCSWPNGEHACLRARGMTRETARARARAPARRPRLFRGWNVACSSRPAWAKARVRARRVAPSALPARIARASIGAKLAPWPWLSPWPWLQSSSAVAQQLRGRHECGEAACCVAVGCANGGCTSHQIVTVAGGTKVAIARFLAYVIDTDPYVSPRW